MKELATEYSAVGNYAYEFLTDESQRDTIKRRACDLAVAAAGQDMIIFLDKTARPVAQLVIKLFRHLNPTGVLPKVRFVNIGSEKGWPITHLLKTEQGAKYTGRTRADLNQIRRYADVVKFFGDLNTAYLAKLIKPSRPEENRLVIDDVVDSGSTRDTALCLFRSVDPQSQYSFIPFLESDRDRRNFSHSDRSPFLPWHSDYTLVADRFDGNSFDDKSFSIYPTRNSQLLSRGRLLRQEFSQLRQEVIADLPYRPL